MPRRIYSVISILILLLFLFGGCASKSAKSDSKGSMNTLNEYQKAEVSNQLADREGSQGGADTSQPKARDDIKKIIKNATIYIEVKNADDSFEHILKWVQTNNGYEFSRKASTDDKFKRINVIFKIDPNRLDSFIAFLQDAGKITNSDIKSDDITDQYYDVSSRLGNLMKGREQFLKIQEKAVTIDDILKVQNELNRISGDIEVLQGKINMWNKMVAESTVTLNITEEADPMKSAAAVSWKFSSFREIMNTMKSGFILTSNTLINIVIWLMIFIISASPIIAIGLIILFVMKRRAQKKDKSCD